MDALPRRPPPCRRDHARTGALSLFLSEGLLCPPVAQESVGQPIEAEWNEVKGSFTHNLDLAEWGITKSWVVLRLELEKA